MQIENTLGTYTWIEDWITIPESELGKSNGRTHGVVVTKAGDVVVFHQAVPAVLIYDADGTLKTSWGDFPGAHGMTLIEENGDEFLWLADETTHVVAKYTLDGQEVMTLDKPQHALYDEGKPYVPTWAVQNPENGDIWVANGYGCSLVHRFDKTGTQLQTLTGEEGAGRFNCPHGISFFPGADGLELFITDRSNSRIVVYDSEGTYLRSSSTCHSPCCFSALGDLLLVPELFCGVKVLDKNSLELIAEFGLSDRVGPSETEGKWWPPVKPEGWPDVAGTEHIQVGQFNSPHGACFAPNGDIYVGEWIIGGRVTKIQKN